MNEVALVKVTNVVRHTHSSYIAAGLHFRFVDVLLHILKALAREPNEWLARSPSAMQQDVLYLDGTCKFDSGDAM